MRSERLTEILKHLNNSSAEIEASAIMSVDGLTMASQLSQGIDEDRVGAMTAALLSLGKRVTIELRRGKLEQAMIKGEHGYVLVVSAGPDAALAVVAAEDAKLGLVFLDVKRAAVKVTEAL